MTPSARPQKPARASDSLLTVDLGSGSTTVLVRQHPRARRASVRITADGQGVVVVIPAWGCVGDGLAVAQEHAQWIRERLAAQPPRTLFADGSMIPLRGRQTLVRHLATLDRGIVEDGDTLRVGGPAGGVAERLQAWLRGEARRDITRRIVPMAAYLGLQPTRISIRDTTSRWGSCSSSRALSFSWRLILAPSSILDYVVAHEMAHLVVRGHGTDFWQIVARLTDDVADSRAWLRRHGRDLFRFG
jgi:predicted metal-dependent hydrolase